MSYNQEALLDLEQLELQTATEEGPTPWNCVETTEGMRRWQASVPERGRYPGDEPRNEATVSIISDGAEDDAVCFLHVDVETASPLSAQAGVRLRLKPVFGMARFLASYLHKNWWTRPFFGQSKDLVPSRTQNLLCQLEDGRHLCLFPLVDGHFKAELTADADGALIVELHSRDSGRRHCRGIALAITWDFDPYKAVDRAVTAGLKATGGGRLRWEKKFPQILNYLGWCTWDAFYHQVNAEGIEAKLKELKVDREDSPFEWKNGWIEVPLDGPGVIEIKLS